MNKRYKAYRYVLKDLVRQEIDFSGTDQRRGLPPPPLQKPCPNEVAQIELPNGQKALAELGGMSIAEAIVQRESFRRYAQEALTLRELSALLWACQGVRKIVHPECALRTVPSAGARHAFETYLAVERVESLQPGLYRYLPFNNRLAQLSVDEMIGHKAAQACLGQEFVASAAVTFFWTAIPARMEWRYDLAAHKVMAIDAGHVCQNLYLDCQAIEAGTCAIAAYDQHACDSLLHVDGEEEFTIYVAPVGKRLQ